MRGGQVAPPAVVQQFGSPSVASRMYFGLGSVSVARYAAPAWIANRVGVLPPVWARAIDLAMAVALLGAGGISAGPDTPQPSLLEKYLSPQLTEPCVFMTTVFSAMVIDAHLLTQVPCPHCVSSNWFSIDPDLSRMSSRSAGRFSVSYIF